MNSSGLYWKMFLIEYKMKTLRKKVENRVKAKNKKTIF